MEFMEDVDAVKQQRKPTSTTADDDHGADLISGLVDDVLLRILGLVGDAREVVRTGTLSRRWRGLWTRVPVLSFSFLTTSLIKSASDAQRYIAFISDVLAQRAQSSDAIERLKITLELDLDCRERDQLLVPSPVGAAETWVRYAAQHGVKSFKIVWFQSVAEDTDDEEQEDEGKERPGTVMALDGIPISANLERLCLDFGGARVRLPATVVFPSLVNLKLESMELAGDSVHLFSGLLSSPRLQKLRMYDVTNPGLQELLIEVRTLLELSLENMHEMRSLELRTPNLHVLRVRGCHDMETLTVSAPKLEELTYRHNSFLTDIDGDLSSVQSLELDLYYSQDGIWNVTSTYLLRHCGSVRCLDVSLHGDLTSKTHSAGLQQLPLITSLKVCIWSSEWHSGDRVASFLTAFSNLRHLSLNFNGWYDSDVSCNHPEHQKSHDISLVHLQEVEFKELAETDCGFQFLRFVLSRTTQLQKVLVNFSKIRQKDSINDLLHMLPVKGAWIDRRDGSYEWRMHR